MSITTKTGDKGQTSLWSGERIWKDDLRVDAYGTLDELDAHVGDARNYITDPEIKNLLIDIQNKLYRVMGQLASKSREYVFPLCKTDVQDLTDTVYKYEQIVDLKGFVIPGSIKSSAKLDICRTIARRAERRIIELSHKEDVPEVILEFCNRLSDFFFILARFVEFKENAIVYKTKPEYPGCEGDKK